MLWENLVVDRLIIHEVHKRQIDKKAVPPAYGQGLLSLGTDGLSMFADRVVSAIGSRSQSMEMAIKPAKPGSLIEAAHGMLGVGDADFVARSQQFADKLTDVQISMNLPGGLLVVFDGSVGTPARRYVGVIKAETHSGFRRTANLQAQFVRDLFLTPQAKLYKLGIFVSDGTNNASDITDGWSVAVYDSQMTTSNRDGAAQYFYEHFLGCELPSTSSRLTRVFYEQTRSFIDRLEVTPEEKADYVSGLYTYLKVDRSPTIDIGDFANKYFPVEVRDGYESHMERRKFPAGVINKDISELGNKLRRRRLTFASNIHLTGPSEAFDSLVTIKDTQVEVEHLDGTKQKRPATEIIIQAGYQAKDD